MTWWLVGLGAWFALSLPFGILVGKFIAVGKGSDD